MRPGLLRWLPRWLPELPERSEALQEIASAAANADFVRALPPDWLEIVLDCVARARVDGF
jgi:hypothetical protein